MEENQNKNIGETGGAQSDAQTGGAQVSKPAPPAPSAAPPVAQPAPETKSFSLGINGNGNNGKKSALSFLTKLMASQKSSDIPSSAPSGLPVDSSAPNMFAVSGSLSAKPFTRAKVDEYSRKKNLTVAKTVFWGVSIAVAVGLSFFMIQLNPDFAVFGDTLAKQYQASRARVISVQTEINKNRLQTAQLSIDRINFLADSFLVNSDQAKSAILSPGQRQSAKDKAEASRQLITDALLVAKNALSAPFGFPLPDVSHAREDQSVNPFESALLQSLQAQEQKETNSNRARLLSNMAQLFQNAPFRGYMNSLDLQALDDEKLTEAVGKIRDLGKDDVALIAQVKEERIKWTEVIDKINSLTKEVDPLYGKDRLFEEIGGIRYSNYTFDQVNRKLSVTGEVRTPVSDSKTFSLIAKVIETFEASDSFRAVEMRDFSKSFGEKTGFTASLKFDMYLE